MPKARVLVTGATGFLGKRLCKKLLEDGYATRAFVRTRSKADSLVASGAEICVGDIGDLSSIRRAMQGIAIVVHAAADTGSVDPEAAGITVQGTKNVLLAAEELGIEQMVYISTCNVYGTSQYKSGSLIDESSFLEKRPEKGGAYTLTKLKAEQIVLKEMGKGAIAITCLRPGTIWGPGGEIFTPMMGARIGERIFCFLGSRRFPLPFVYLDNLVSAIVGTLRNPAAYNRVYNVVDQEKLTKEQYKDLVLKRLYPGALYIFIPYVIVYTAVWMQEFLFGLMKRKPFLTRYRLTSSQRRIAYSAAAIRMELDWHPPVCLEEAVERIIEDINA